MTNVNNNWHDDDQTTTNDDTTQVLLVSPERFLNVEFMYIFSATPVISLLVVDEAHCVSEWSHYFWPSYMRLRASLLRTRLNVHCILAMTSTATTKTLDDVMCALEIPQTNFIKSAHMKDDLLLSVSLSRNRQVWINKIFRSGNITACLEYPCFAGWRRVVGLVAGAICPDMFSSLRFAGFLTVLLSAFSISHGVVVLGCWSEVKMCNVHMARRAFT
ncbi:hypothetical protein RHGRI_029424 [Rhododendron griersonianum]|uniref:Helicase ATP-binding domain-containing protein n=1 Tax=Rhododendron griersonianum TaxID=479676 RepID=A0AAV6IQ58_9ERIC|nr:hypothetical protein RHGRI_029424 [Rhododendron griersonianum]